MELSRRLRRPRWTDARLLVGAVLVVLAVVATYLLITSATATSRVWASARPIVPGQAISSEDLTVVEVNLADLGDRYLSAEADVTPRSSVRSVIPAGELIPAAALVPLAELAGRVVAIDVSGSVPTGVNIGILVDVWALPDPSGADGSPQEPSQIVHSAPVAHIDRDAGSFGANDGARIEVFVSNSELPGLLSRLDGQSILSVVAAPAATDDSAPSEDPGGGG